MKKYKKNDFVIVMVFQLQTNSPSKLKKSWFFKNIFFLYEFLSKIQIGFDYHRTWWYQFFRYFLCKIFSPEISCDFDLSSSRSSLRSLAENMKRYMVLVVVTGKLDFPLENFEFHFYYDIMKFWYITTTSALPLSIALTG